MTNLCKRGRPAGSKNLPKAEAAPLTFVSLEDAYYKRPRERFPEPRYLIRTDQRRACVVVYDTEVPKWNRSEYPLAAFLQPGEAVAGGSIDDRGNPQLVIREG